MMCFTCPIINMPLNRVLTNLAASLFAPVPGVSGISHSDVVKYN